MAAAAPSRPARRRPARRALVGGFTLLDLIRVLSEVTEDDREVVATVQHLLRSGRVRLIGTFRDEPPID